MTQDGSGERELLHLTFSIPKGADKQKVTKKIVELVQSLDELHRAVGGDGLELVKAGEP